MSEEYSECSQSLVSECSVVRVSSECNERV